MKRDRFNTAWRRMAAAVYDRPRDARVFGHIEADVSVSLAWIAEQAEQGRRFTITHLLTAAFARTLAEDVPELNCYVRLGTVIPRDDVGIMLAVDVAGKDLSAVLIRQAHQKTVTQIAEELASKAAAKAEGEDDRAIQKKQSLSKLPWPLRKWAFEALRWSIYEAQLPLGFTGLGPDMFGSMMITNIGTLGLNTGYAALMPATNVPCVIATGKYERKAVVRDEQIVIRDILPVTGTFDHRIIDGHQAGTLAAGVLRRLDDPASLDRAVGT